MLTDQEIQKAINTVSIGPDNLHEHPDAYTWLDAQKKLQSACRQSYPLKHYIEKWAGRYVSESDVKVPAYLHSGVKGKHPNFNISSNLTEPCRSRLNNIPEAMTQLDYHTRHDPKTYKFRE